MSIQKNKEHELAVKQSLVSKNILINQLQERFDQGQIDRMELEKEMFALLDIDLELNRANNASIQLGLASRRGSPGSDISNFYLLWLNEK